jgi:hypothetical protein
MPTLLTPIRGDRAYIGFAQETTPGTPVAPTIFPRWIDGSNIQIDVKAEDVWEGDGSRRLGSIIKNGQQVKIKLVCLPRPNELGALEKMAMGAGSDTFTAPATNTTLSTGATPGATTISLTANTGLTTAGTVPLVLNPGGADEEFVTVTTPGTGTGPYVYTLANGATIQKTHSTSEAVKSQPSHVFTDQVDGDYWTFEVSLGDTAGIIIRVRDCKAETVKRSGKKGGILTYDVEVSGIACIVQASPATITYDSHTYFLFAQGAWTLDGSTTGDALAVESFDISQKNNLDTEIQTEQLVLSAIIFGNLNVDVGINLVFQNGNRIAETYFGSATGTADSQAIYAGSLSLLFTLSDGFNHVQYNVPTLDYTKAEPPAPKKDGKAMRIALSATSVSNFSQNAYLLQTTVANTTFAAY